MNHFLQGKWESECMWRGAQDHSSRGQDMQGNKSWGGEGLTEERFHIQVFWDWEVATQLPIAGRDGGALRCVMVPESCTCSSTPAMSNINEQVSRGAESQMEKQRILARPLENHLSLIFVPQPPHHPHFITLHSKIIHSRQSKAMLTWSKRLY